MKQPLAIVGASARAAAASAVRAGFQPIAADLFADVDLRAIATATRIAPYPEGLADWLRAVEPPVWMYTGALENHSELIDQMAWIAPLWGNPGDVLARVRSPWELAAALRDAGLLFPETRASSDGLPRDGSWLVKTYRVASGSGVWELVESGRGGEGETGTVAADVAIESPPLPVSRSPPLCFQQRVAGTPCAAIYVAAAGAAALLGATRQLVGEPWLGAQHFQYAGSIGPLVLDKAQLESVARCGNLLAERFELIGLFGVDFMLDGDRAWALEVNPRYVASVEIVERAAGIHAIAAHADACRGLPISSPQSAGGPPPLIHGKAILFAKRDVAISESFAEMALAETSSKPWPTLADVSPANTRIEAGRPVLTIFANGATDGETEARLRERVADIECKLYAERA